MIADSHGHYQTVSLLVDVAIRNGTDGNFLERGLVIKNSTVSEVVRLPTIINAGKLTEIAVYSFTSSRPKLILGDDTGNLHVVENERVAKSIKIANEAILGLSVQQLGAIYYASSLK